MNSKDLIQLGVPPGPPVKLGLRFVETFIQEGGDSTLLQEELVRIITNPAAFPRRSAAEEFARALYSPPFKQRAELAPWRQWGAGLEAPGRAADGNACALPIAVAGALMPDAHVGYGLPIGGVLATENSVIPYAVGVDIACRMKLSVYERKGNTLAGQKDRLANLIESETRFGMGCEFKQRRQHEVMDDDWSVSPITQRMRDKAWAQLGTSGSGNHFVEFGTFTIERAELGLEPGEYLALLTHSGSRGTGAQVCQHYSRLAMDRHASCRRS
jgi:tRNA-splicing ligase RtcB